MAKFFVIIMGNKACVVVKVQLVSISIDYIGD